jgi:Zn finger protein HypA/HybF involved in hydrogenase expression
MDNRSTDILTCANCGKKIQTVTTILRRRPCPVCRGEMRAQSVAIKIDDFAIDDRFRMFGADELADL